MPAKPPPGKKGSGPAAIVGRKIGPLPAWAWVVLIVGGYVVVQKLRGGSSGAAAAGSGGQTLGATQGTSPSPAQSDTSASSDSSGVSNSSLANILGYENDINSNLVGGTLGALQSGVDINSNLTSALVSQSGSITSLGETALGQSGAIEQAIIDHLSAPQQVASTTQQSSAAAAPAAQTQTTYVAPSNTSNAAATIEQPAPIADIGTAYGNLQPQQYYPGTTTYVGNNVFGPAGSLGSHL